MSDEADRWMTVEQVAEMLLVNPETVRRWIRSGELPVLNIAGPKGGYRIRRRDLDAYIAKHYGPVGKGAA
jgi:excisionase family DNA binding protein